MSNQQESKYPISDAIKEGNIQLAKLLINKASSELYKPDEDQRSPLHWACSINSPELVDCILSKSDPNLDIDEVTDLSGWTPLHVISSIGNLTIFNKIYNHFIKNEPDLNLKTNSGTTYLDLAISKKHIDLVRELIDLKVNCRSKDKRGISAIIRASSIGSKTIIEMLLVKGKVNINAKDNDGWTCLHHALSEGYGDIAVYLVKQGADASIRNDKDELPEQVAVDEKVRSYFVENMK